MNETTTAPPDEIDRLTAAIDLESADRGPRLVELARLHVASGSRERAVAALTRATETDRRFRTWSAAARVLRDVPGPEQLGLRPLRVTVAGTSTVDQLTELLPLPALQFGLHLQVSNTGYGQYELAAHDDHSGLYANDPHAIVLAPDSHSLGFGALTGDPQRTIAEAADRWTSIWTAIRRRTSSPIFQLNFVPPRFRALGGGENGNQDSRWRVIDGLNAALGEHADAGVSIVDARSVAFTHGLSNWWSDRYWFHAKQAVSLGALPLLATEIASVMGARMGRTRKCIVVDLDNTLWGGVVGDDGVDELQLEGSALGEAHLALQHRLRDLRDTGVLLAVCSKNDEAVAKAPFLERTDMVLQLDDFAAFAASWAPKPAAIESIARRLNLGLDAMVFLDDNPAERALVRQHLPMVDVLELPDDVASYARVLEEYRGFERASVTAEDRARTEQYRGRSAALELQEASASLDDFLENLQMVAELAPLSGLTLPRVAQLINKTNQWNMTTRRRDTADLEALLDTGDTEVFSVRLRDRFTDHGIVAVAVLVQRDREIEIDTLLMSCRVIGRGLERVMVDHCVDIARGRRARRLIGVYRPTPKNSSVATIYSQLGFSAVDATSGETTWALEVETAETLNRHIEVSVTG